VRNSRPHHRRTPTRHPKKSGLLRSARNDAKRGKKAESLKSISIGQRPMEKNIRQKRIIIKIT